MTTSHISTPKPSGFLALVCLAVVHRLRPEWVAVPLFEAARTEGVAAQRLSRLCTRAIALFEPVIGGLIRIGRPLADRKADQDATELVMLRSLLAIATNLLSRVKLRGQAVRALVVGAFLWFKKKHPMLTQKAFCEALALSPRTLRSWLKRDDDAETKTPVEPLPPKRPEQKRPPRRPRFGFQVTLPDTQLAADTTDLAAFDVPLKLIAAQDIGGRDQDLLDSVIVDDHENSELVVQMLTEAIAGRNGIQVITDQGTPYMAEATRKALEELDADHAPQKEGDPQGKATVERAFGTIKRIARPLLSVTNRIARAIDALRDPAFAIAAATLILTALLKAYQAGARAARRADDARSGLSAEALAEMAKQSRERAHAEERSARLLLTRIHQVYGIDSPLTNFIRSMRLYPLEVLKQTERAFAMHAHRDDIHDRTAYFARIAQRLNDEYQSRLAQRRAEKEERKRQLQEEQQTLARRKARNAEPASWLLEALNILALQWLPEKAKLFLGGSGMGRSWLRQAIGRLIELHGPQAAVHIANGVFTTFENAHVDHLGPAGVRSIRAVLDRHLPPDLPDSQNVCTQKFGYAIFQKTGPPTRPAPRRTC